MWWLRRSIRMTSTSACRSARVAATPAKPPPMMTTRLRSDGVSLMTAVACSGRLSTRIALMGHLVAALVIPGFSRSVSGTINASAAQVCCANPAREKPASCYAGLLDAGNCCEHELLGRHVRRALRKIGRTLLEEGRERFLGVCRGHPLHELLAFTLDRLFELADRRLLQEPLARHQRAARFCRQLLRSCGGGREQIGVGHDPSHEAQLRG